MRKSFRGLKLPQNLTKDPRLVARVVLGVLLLANLIAAYAVIRPVGGSAEELDAQIAILRQQVQQRQASLKRLRALSTKIEHGRKEGDKFLDQYFLQRRTAFSTIVGDIDKSAKDSGIKPKGASYEVNPIEGSNNLSMMTITSAYEGTYHDLLEFVNRLDKSPRFLILDTLTVAPQQGGGSLNVSIKFNLFVREELPQT
jgi:type IV pilus assembly protein PilO